MQRLYSQLPDFARPTHPMMRYVLLGSGRRSNLRTQIIRALLAIIAFGIAIVFGYQIATNFGRVPLDAASSLDSFFLVLYWPLVGLQLAMRLVALGSTSGIIASEVQHGTWDTLKVTTNGAMLTMQTRWAAVFYRLRLLLILVLVIRLVFVVIALINLVSFQGHYLDLLLSGTTPFGQPDVSKEATIIAGIFLTATMLTAALLAPFTAIALDASVGMLVGTLTQNRFLGIVGQVGLLVARVLVTGLALELGAIALLLSTQPGILPTLHLQDVLANNPVLGWLASLFAIAEGDMGLTFLHLPHVQLLWADYAYGALVGVAFLGYTLLQAALANVIVKWAGRRAARSSVAV